MKRTLPVLAVAVVLGGCGSGGPKTAEMLAGAHASLEADDTTMARQWLSGAAGETGTSRQRREVALLTAELQVRTGEAEAALPGLRAMLAGAPDDPRANEVAGKALLMTGDFTDATGHFVAARQHYSRAADRQRAGDLAALSRGLESYARGKVALAEQQWGTIRDERLRLSVLGANDRLSAQSNDGRDLFFARKTAR